MKRYLLLGFALLILVASVSGLALTFQNQRDFSAQAQFFNGNDGCTETNGAWIQNTTGGNSYIQTGVGHCCNCCGGASVLVSKTPMQMNYAAATIVSRSNGWYGDTGVPVYLYDANGALLNSTYINPVGSLPARVEVKVYSGGAAVFLNGQLNKTISALGVYPSYIGFGSSYGSSGCYDQGTTNWDDVVWGSTESQYIFGMPENGYFLMKDVLNSAASGFYRVNQTNPNGSPTLITSFNFTSTYGKNSGNPEFVVLTSPAGQSYSSYNTTSTYAGSVFWDLTSFFATAPYGLYRTEITPQLNSTGFATSGWLPYIGSGATISFDKNSYAVGETAVVTVTVSNTYYTKLKNYRVTIQDIYGNAAFTDTALSFTQQANLDWKATTTYTWTDSNAEGVYFGLIYADTVSGGSTNMLLNFNSADLSSVLVVNGYIKDATTTNAISGATVNVTQGVTTDALTSAVDGNYTTVSSFSANAPTTIVAGASGYETYQHVFTPLAAGSIQINLTLMPLNPIHTGIALGGIARTPPFNRTIDSATVTIKNGGTEYLATTNSAGYYIQNSMPNGTIWGIWGSKTGFANSSIYQKLVVGI